MAEPTERDQFTDEEEGDFLDEEQDDQGLGSEDEEGGAGAGAGGKRKRLGKSLGGFGKRGVCYLSRVPPHMNPSHIRQMLSKYGEVLRIYLVPEGKQSAESTLAYIIAANFGGITAQRSAYFRSLMCPVDKLLWHGWFPSTDSVRYSHTMHDLFFSLLRQSMVPLLLKRLVLLAFLLLL